MTTQIAHKFVIAIFGVLVPVTILVQAYQGGAFLLDNVAYKSTDKDLVETFAESKKSIKTANDYALFSLVYTEHANQKTMINKQVMKVSVMQIGFSVISIGMMLIVLGINSGKIEGAIEAGGIKFDFKTGSTGIAIFMVGAAMAAAGGIIKNDYTTGQIPAYYFEGELKEEAQTIAAYTQCKSQKNVPVEKCFFAFFEKINSEKLK